ncbi:NAD-dependent epimerase/dehydratase family protein, partial [Candidatus Neomarinimicrobiota bacterium]
MSLDSRILVAGHRGLVGGTIFRKLGDLGYKNLIGLDRDEIDFMDSGAVAKSFSQNKPDYIFLAAAKVGGIVANNTLPADFIYQNLVIQNNIIHQAFVSEAKGLLFLGSSCIYPRDCPQPIKEEYLLTGLLEPTNKAY